MLTTPMGPVPAISYLISYGGTQRPHRCQLKKKSSAKYPIPVGVLCKCADKHRIGYGALTKHACRGVRVSAGECVGRAYKARLQGSKGECGARLQSTPARECR